MKIVARKLSKNQSKAKAKTSNQKIKTQVPDSQMQNEELPVDSVIVEEKLQPAATKPARRSSKKASVENQGETKEQLMKRVKHELIKTLVTAAVSMAAGIMLAEFITLH